VCLGCYDDAASLAHETLELIQEQDIVIVRALALRILSTIAITQGRYDEARSLQQERRKLLVNSPPSIQIGLACESYVATASGEYALSAQLLIEALRGSDQTATSPLWTLLAGALLLGTLGAVRKALEIYAAAAQVPFVSNSRWFDDVVGAPLMEMARTLPAGVLEEIEEQAGQWNIDQARRILLEELEKRGG
jgi:ATP/maltotriose-dependent transcriptional regulator MalT